MYQSNSELIQEKIMKGEHFNENPSSTLSIDLIMMIKAILQKYNRKRRSESRTNDNCEYFNQEKRHRSSSRHHQRIKKPSPSPSTSR
jgi:hypothetical protein